MERNSRHIQAIRIAPKDNIYIYIYIYIYIGIDARTSVRGARFAHDRSLHSSWNGCRKFATGTVRLSDINFGAEINPGLLELASYGAGR